MSLPNKGKILALDLGKHNTGVAISDENQQVAFIRDEIVTNDEKSLLKTILKIIEEDNIVGLIIGIPKNLKGEDTLQTDFSKRILLSLLSTKIPCITVDERLTTKNVYNRIKTTKQITDSEVAQLLLDSYLSSNTDTPGSSSP